MRSQFPGLNFAISISWFRWSQLSWVQLRDLGFPGSTSQSPFLGLPLRSRLSRIRYHDLILLGFSFSITTSWVQLRDLHLSGLVLRSQLHGYSFSVSTFSVSASLFQLLRFTSRSRILGLRSAISVSLFSTSAVMSSEFGSGSGGRRQHSR